MSSPASSSDDQEEVQASEESQQSPQKDEKRNDEKATDAKDKNDDDDSESDSKDEENEDNEEVGLLDRPVEVSGSRERKKVERLEVSFNTPNKDKHEIPEGSGDKLGECPRIEHQLQKNAVKELKLLHKVLFGRLGSANEIKRNIRKFSGFTFTKGSAEYDKKKATLDKMKNSELKHLCEVLDLERTGTKEEIVNRIMEFALRPKDSGRKVPKKKSSARGVKRKREEKKSTSGKRKKADSSEDEDEEDIEDNSSEKAASDEEEEEISDEDKKKKSKTTQKRNQTKQKKAPAKKADKKAASKKKKAASDDSSSDDEPLVKIAKSPPTDAEIKTLVKKILQSADLQEITMKKVIKQVFDGFPDFDLSDKKDFIKATVKSVIS